MRMEEKGLLIPACTTPHSGRRYYDNHNIALILQILQFQSMGFNAEETSACFAQDSKTAELFNMLENKLYLLQRNVEEMRLYVVTAPDMSVQIMTLPETTCCVRRAAAAWTKHGSGLEESRKSVTYPVRIAA